VEVGRANKEDPYGDRRFERRMAVSREVRTWSAEARRWFIAVGGGAAVAAVIGAVTKAGILG
jgi:hypothetical protein